MTYTPIYLHYSPDVSFIQSSFIYLFIFIRNLLKLSSTKRALEMISIETKIERASLNIKSLKLKGELNKTRGKKAGEKIPGKIFFFECVIIDVRDLSCHLNIILYSLIIRNKKSYCRRKRGTCFKIWNILQKRIFYSTFEFLFWKQFHFSSLILQASISRSMRLNVFLAISPPTFKTFLKDDSAHLQLINSTI